MPLTPIRQMVMWLGFALALVAAAGLSWEASYAYGIAFENPHPPAWTSYAPILHWSSLLLPPLLIVLSIPRHKALCGALVGFLTGLFMLWMNRHNFIPTGWLLPPLRELPGLIFEEVTITAVYGVITALAAWSWRKFIARKSTDDIYNL